MTGCRCTGEGIDEDRQVKSEEEEAHPSTPKIKVYEFD
jgi:hypothetical protein